MELENLYQKALDLVPLTAEEGTAIYHEAPLEELMFIGDKLGRFMFPATMPAG